MTTVAHVVGNLHVAARLIAPERDWSWLACLKLASQPAPSPKTASTGWFPAGRRSISVSN